MQSEKKITLKSIANNIYPEWDLDDWFHWPPNMFALISIVFKSTGVYKYIVSNEKPEGRPWADSQWQSKIEKIQIDWLKYVANSIAFKNDASFIPQKAEYYLDFDLKPLMNGWDSICINDLRNACGFDKRLKEKYTDNKESISNFIETLITIYAIADGACRGLGLVGQNIKSDDRDLKLYHCYANILLNNTGSLSTIPKFHGVVLPKMRTPQTGLSLRSMSHHLTFHSSEVEVMWRILPWSNNNKQSLNILAVPFPKQIDESNFEVVSDTFSSSRYFKCKTGSNENFEYVRSFLEGLIDEIIDKAKNNCQIDIVVFPEMSLDEKAYLFFLKELNNKILKDHENAKIEEKHKCNHFSFYPIIIAGVVSENRDANEAKSDHEAQKSKPFRNEVRIATYFAGKWYDIKQHKHHRWHLDKSQVVQYQLEGLFPTDREWFEYCTIEQRRLTILAPNGWLALTSLICEDLAQQEPVSEIIRGIGPTLLFALLSDGPQLTNRWSARYANVLADDPGSAVLSLSSEGMVKRSKKSSYEDKDLKPTTSQVVGLWKDMIRGYKPILLEEGADAILFTISANYKEEFTLDGRSDNTNASVFEMSTLTPIQVRIGRKKKNENKSRNPIIGKWDDIRDISAFIYAIDAVIDLAYIQKDDSRIEIIFLLLKNANEKHLKKKNIEYSHNHTKGKTKIFIEIDLSIQKSWLDPHLIGIEANVETNASYEDVLYATNELENIYNKVRSWEFSNESQYYKILIEICDSNLKNMKINENRMILMVNLAALENIYSKLSNYKSKNINKISVSDSLKMRSEIEKIRSEHNLKQF